MQISAISPTCILKDKNYCQNSVSGEKQKREKSNKKKEKGKISLGTCEKKLKSNAGQAELIDK